MHFVIVTAAIGGLKEVEPAGTSFRLREGKSADLVGGLQRTLCFERSLEGMYSVHSVRCDNGVPRKWGLK